MAAQDDHSGQNDLSVTGEELRDIRLKLGLSQVELEALLRIGNPAPTGRTVRRWEAKKGSPVPGPVAVIMEMLRAGAFRGQGLGKVKMKHDVIKLYDGHAEPMGDGVFVVFQEADGEVQTVVLTPDDLKRMSKEPANA